MEKLPESEASLVVRTYFGDAAGWADLREEVMQPSSEGYVPMVEFVDDSQFEGWDAVRLVVGAHPHRDLGTSVMFVADRRAISTDGHPLQVVRVGSWGEAPFRCRADALHEVDANLRLANLDWDDLRAMIGESGVYEGTARQDPSSTPRTSTIYFDDVRSPSMEVPDDFRPEPNLPARIVARRHFVSPATWVVVITGENAKPGRFRVAGPFGEYRAAVLFQHSIADLHNSGGNTEVVQIEVGNGMSNFYRP